MGTSTSGPTGWPPTCGRNGVGPGDHVGVYLTNGPEYLETMLAAYKLRAVPINVNYRYVEDELRYLFADAGVRAVVHDAEFADRMAAVRDDLPELAVELAVGEGYEAALAAADPAPCLRGAQQRRPLHPLHRRHHRHAQGRRLAPGGRLSLLHRRRGPRPPARRHHHTRGASSSASPRRGRPPSSCRWPPSCTLPGSGRACPGCSPAARSCSSPARSSPTPSGRPSPPRACT